MWLLSLLMSPKVIAGLVVAALVGAYGTYSYGYSKGYELAELKGQTEIARLVNEYRKVVEQARQVIAVKQNELDNLQKDYIAMSEKRLQRNRDLQEKLNEYKEKLAGKPECNITIDDVERLPAIE